MKTYDKMIKCYNPCPKPTPPIDCNKVIAEYHRLIKEAEELFKQADMLAYRDAYEYIWKALNSLDGAVELIAKGTKITDEANIILDKSGCSSKCNRNSCDCKQLKNEYEKLYALETKKIVITMGLLEKAMCELKEAFELDKKAGKIEEEYIKCVHGNNCK